MIGGRRRRGRPRIRDGQLPHATFVRDAVVVACDGRPSGDAAIRFAVLEARLRSAKLVVVITYLVSRERGILTSDYRSGDDGLCH